MKKDKELKYTPMIQQYLKVKEEHPDSILFFRLGDFYEMFFEDAKIAGRELEIVITKRDCGNNQKCAMCGVPYHVADQYISKLVSKGYKVAICEQLEDPRKAKGLVKRDVIRVITPGTIVDGESIDKGTNNFILSIVEDHGMIGLTYCDITTGELFFTEIPQSKNQPIELDNEITKINPVEMLYDRSILEEKNLAVIENKTEITKTQKEFIVDEFERYEEYINFQSESLSTAKKTGVASVYYLLSYLYKYHNEKLVHMDLAKYYEYNDYLDIDSHSIVNLEIQKNLYTNTKKGSLFGVLDATRTSMGSRLLHSFLERPLMDREEILKRQDYVHSLYEATRVSLEISNILNEIYDLERILGKLSYSKANGRDLLALKTSILNLPIIKDILENSDAKNLMDFGKKIDTLEDIFQLIDRSIMDDAPILITEGNLIKSGFDDNLDRIRENKLKGHQYLIDFENEEKERLNISNLKIVFNKKTGYFIDITKSHLKKVPDDYIKKQTLTNSERFVNARLLEIQSMILDSEAEIFDLEYRIFNKVREEVLENIRRIQDVCDKLAFIDVTNSLAEVAQKNNYVRPNLNNVGILDIVEARHPVVEESIGYENYISNNINIGNGRDNIQIITGPNMSGKSTYLRQTALLVIMSQIGSFIPASYGNISIVDKIFTRIGASDNLYKGESTFMVEMKEMSNIIQNATQNSLLILDEVGRGTSTYDGLSIAWSILEYISKTLKAKTLFATHFHELTDLEFKLKNVINLKVEIEEYKGEIIFLRKIIRGKSDKSYGIEVAKLAGLPSSIIRRAKNILDQIEVKDKNLDIKEFHMDQVGFSESIESSLEQELKEINIENLTPLEAMKILDDFINQARDI